MTNQNPDPSYITIHINDILSELATTPRCSDCTGGHWLTLLTEHPENWEINAGHDITCPTYTPEQRTQLAEQATLQSHPEDTQP